jgi:hypothetical protein
MKHDYDDTFACVLLACPCSPEIESKIAEWGYSTVIETLISAEDQAIDPEWLWPFGWENILARVSPVQLVYRWDPRPFLLSTLQDVGFGPRLVGAGTWSEANIIYFSRDTPVTDESKPPAEPAPLPQDELRLDMILAETLHLALTREQGILFVGGWGWSYEKDEIQGTQTVLRSAGMMFTTRHA